jgi:hypothetical protein
MAEPDFQPKSEVIDYLEKEILTRIPTEIDQLDYRNIEELYGKIHILRYYCLKKDFGSDIADRFDTMLEISRTLWDFLRDNIETLMSMKAARRTLYADLSAQLLGLQAVLSGESGKEAFNDLILTSISVFLGWKGDVIWVDTAKDELETVSKAYLISLRDELWRFIDAIIPSDNELTLEKVADIGEKMELLLQFISSDDMPVSGRFVFISQIYVLLLRLNIIKIIVSINEQKKSLELPNGE